VTTFEEENIANGKEDKYKDFYFFENKTKRGLIELLKPLHGFDYFLK
jgi:hypothetical protein